MGSNCSCSCGNDAIQGCDNCCAGIDVKPIQYVEGSSTFSPSSDNWVEGTATFTVEFSGGTGPYAFDWNINFGNTSVPYRATSTLEPQLTITLPKSDLRTDGTDYSFWMRVTVRDSNRSCACSPNGLYNINRKP